MKNRIYLLLFVILISINYSSAQDLIVTNSGDSIRCKISSIKYERIFFILTDGDQQTSSFLPVNDISYYSVDYYGEIKPTAKRPSVSRNVNLDISANAAFSYRIAPVEGGNALEEDYYRGLKKGFNYGADLIFYFNDVYGIGLKYSASNYKNELKDISITYQNGVVRYGDISDNISVSYIGPGLFTRRLTKNMKGYWVMGMTIGYIRYFDDCKVIDPMTVSGETIGLGFDVSYDHQIYPGVSLGGKVSYITGNLTEVKIDDGTSVSVIKLQAGQYESLSRIDAGLVLKLNIF